MADIVISARTADEFKRIEDAIKALPKKVIDIFNAAEEANGTIILSRNILYISEIIIPKNFIVNYFNMGEYSTQDLLSGKFEELKQSMLRIEGKYDGINYTLKFMNINKTNTAVVFSNI